MGQEGYGTVIQIKDLRFKIRFVCAGWVVGIGTGCNFSLSNIDCR